ncbi:hypothetical protein NM688_g7919 [Phlebia brevispora]|uniref:Uncharacterized protein n=1 Tax=Phlebia brevispora TaxID=194682 RepID=A0ACC1RZL3_9APHY|nr:hypothetical protein NM688_g7919 [Phlebia brevispora]
MMTSAKPPSTPRLSASVIVVNPRNEILLVHRNPKAGAFAGMHVFPGGNFDQRQDDSLGVTAIRETFEETGLLLASSESGKTPPDSVLDNARENIHSQKQLFQEFLADNDMVADISALLPFTQWITPPNVPRRFHTHFYVTFLETTPSSSFSSGTKVERIPTPDGGQEVIAARFVQPSTALRECESHKIRLMPPQFYLVTTLASILQGPVNTPEQRHKVHGLSTGAFGRLVINPMPLRQGAPEGWSVLTYEGDEARGGKAGRLHRSLVKFAPGNTVTDVVLQRNFDIYTEIEDLVAAKNAKL